MRITMESTAEIATVNGRPARRWRGRTAAGVDCDVFVACVRVRAEADNAAFERELRQAEVLHGPNRPGEAIDLRLLT